MQRSNKSLCASVTAFNCNANAEIFGESFVCSSNYYINSEIKLNEETINKKIVINMRRLHPIISSFFVYVHV